MAIKVQVHERGLRRSIEKTVSSVNRRGLRVNLNGKQFSRPLGKITGQVSEFNKSLEASNARVLAFGASVGIIYGVQRAFTELAKTVIEVEKAMADINVVMGLSSSKLEDFSQGLFRVAKNTAQSFDEVSKAATEFARQGLTMEETLKRTNDALILVRLTGMDAAEAVKGLTAAINTFSDASLTSTQILDKMAAVDVRFAVSTEDLIDAVSRAGAVAQDAGVNFDQLLGTVTAAQQMTARGGKVIGNSLKTIFTRIQRGSTIDALENLGIAVRDVQGNTLPAIQALKNLSDTYDQVGDAAKSSIAEKVGGVFQINILKALIKDQRNETDLLSRATKVSSNASGEAHRKNILLQKTLHSLGKETVISVKELANTIGQLSLAPGIRDVFDVVKNSSEWLNSALSKDSDDWGSKAAKGFLKGLGKVLTGPGLVLFVGILGKLAGMTMKFLGGSVLEMMKLTTQTQKQKIVQASINQLLSQNMGLQQKLLALSGNKAAQERVILTLLQQQAAAAARVAAVSKGVAPAVVRGGFGPTLRPGKSEGHVPNYVLSQEKIAEKMGAYAGGYRPGKVKAINIPGEGRSVMNTAEKVVRYPGMAQPEIRPPKASPAGKQHRKAFEKTHGFNPYSTGFVPNYALTPNMIAGLRAKMRPGSNASPNEIKIAKQKLAEHFAKSGGEGALDVNAPWSELYAERLARENFGRRNSSGETRFFGKGHVPNYGMRINIPGPSPLDPGYALKQGPQKTAQKSVEKARYTAIKYSGLRDSVLSYGGRKFGVDKKDDYLTQAIKQDELIRNLAEKRGVKFHEVVNSGRKEDSSFYSRIIPNLKPWKDMEPHVLGRMDYQPKGLIRLPLEEYLSTIKSGKFTSLSNYETLVGKDMGYNQIRGGVTRHLKGGSPPKGSGSFGEHALDWNMIKAHGIPMKNKGFVPNYMPWVPKTIGSLKEHMWSARGGQWRNSDTNSLVQHSLGEGLTKSIKNKIIGTEGYKSFAGELGAIPNVKTSGFYDWVGGLKDKGNAFLPKGLGGTKTSNPIIQDYDSSMISSFDNFVKYASGNQKQAAVSEFFSSKNLSGLTATSKESGLGWQKATSTGALNLKDSKVWDMLSKVKHETLISHIQQKKGFETIPMYEHGYGSPGSGFSIVPPSQQNTKDDFIQKFYSKTEGSIKKALSRQKSNRNKPSGDIFDVLAKSGRLEDILTKELGGNPSRASLAKAAQAKTQKPQGEAGRIVSMPYGQWRATLGWRKKEGNNIGEVGALAQIDAMRGAKQETWNSMAAIEQDILARARAKEIAAVEARDRSHVWSKKPWEPTTKQLKNKTPAEQLELIEELRRKYPPPPGSPPPIAFSKLAKMGKNYRSMFPSMEKMEGRHGTTPFPPRDEKAFLESQKRFAAAELKSQQPTVAVTPGSNEPMAMGLSLSSGDIWKKAVKKINERRGLKRRKLKRSADSDREHDIIDAIKQVSPSGIKTTSGHKYAGELDSVGLLAKGAGRSLRSKSEGRTIDQIVNDLPEYGYSPGSVDDLWAMISSANDQRVLAQAALYRGNIENATLTALTSGGGIGRFMGMKDIKTLKESGLKQINSEKLRVGQTFEVRGHPFKVKSFNLENGHLELASLGQGVSGSAGSIRHSIRSGESIYIDGGKLNNTQPGQKLGDPFSKGFVPNYAMISPGASNILRANPSFTSATVDSIKRESAFGVTPQVVAAPQLRSGTNPGLAVVNKEQEGGSLAKARKLHGGLNPKQGKSLGHVPNYSMFDPFGNFSIPLGDADAAAKAMEKQLRKNKAQGLQRQADFEHSKGIPAFPQGSKGAHVDASKAGMKGFWGDTLGGDTDADKAYRKSIMALSPELKKSVKLFEGLNKSTTAYHAEQARATGGLKAIRQDPAYQGHFNQKAIAETLRQDKYKKAGLSALGSSPSEAKIHSAIKAFREVTSDQSKASPEAKRQANKSIAMMKDLLRDSKTTFTRITRSDNQMKEGERKVASAQVRAEDQKALSAIARNKAIQKSLNTAQQYSGFGKWQDIVRPGLPAQSAGLDKGKTKQLMRTLAKEFGQSKGLRDTRFLMGAQHGGTDPTTQVQRALARDFMKTVQDAGIKSSQGHLASSGYLKGGFFDKTPGSNMKSGGGALYGGTRVARKWNAARDSVQDKTPAYRFGAGLPGINPKYTLNQAATKKAEEKARDKRAQGLRTERRERDLSKKHGNALREHSKALTGFNKAVKGGTFIDRIRTRLSKTGLGRLLGGTGEAKAVKASHREAMKTAMTSGSSRMADRMHGNLAAQAAVAAEARATAKTDAAKAKILKGLEANPKPKMGINYHAGRYASYGDKTLGEIRQQHGMMGAMGAGTQRIGAGTKDFMKNAAKSLGTPRPGMGSMGMGFALPMLAGYLTPDQGKYERSDYDEETGKFKVNREQGRQNLQPLLTGAGMGAMIAGIPGMIVGAGIGWVKAMNDLTLTTKEIADGMEKNIQRISASVQAADVLMPMVEKRAKASRMGDAVASSRIGSEIRNALMKITDPSIQAEMIGNISSPEAFGKVLEKHSRDLALQQNVSGAMLSMSEGGKRGLSRAGSQIGGIIFQRMDDIDKGLITVRDRQGEQQTKESMMKDLKALSETAAEKNSSGLSSSEIKALRRRAHSGTDMPGFGNVTSGRGVAGMITGAALAVIAVGLVASMVATGGLAAPVATAAATATGFAPTLTAVMGGVTAGGILGGKWDKGAAQDELAAVGFTTEMFDVIGQLKDLGAISEEHAKFLTTAYMDSNLSGLALSKEINKAIERYEKIDEGLKLQSERIFNVNLAYDQLFHKLKKESIRIKEEGRHVGQTTAIRGQAHSSFSSTAGEQAEVQRDFAFKKLSISQESTRKSTEVDLRASYIDWMRKGPMAKLGAPDKVGLVGEIERQDRPELKTITGLTDYFKNDFTYQFDLLKGIDRKSQKSELALQQDSLNKILNDKGKSNSEKEVAFKEDPKFKGIVNTGGIEAYKKRIDELLKALEALPDGQALGEGVAIYEREIKLNKKNLENLAFKDKQLQDQLKLIKEANENAQTELRLQTEINIAKGKMLTHIGVLNSRFSLGLSGQQLTLGEEKGSLSLDKNFLKNTQEKPFRYNNESKQFESQQSLMEGVQSEEHKIRKAENVIQAKEEIQRFLSNEKLIYSLDNLRGQVDALSATITGSKPDDTASFALSDEDKEKIQEQTKTRIEAINKSSGVTGTEEKLAGVRAHNKALADNKPEEVGRQKDIRSSIQELDSTYGMLKILRNTVKGLGEEGDEPRHNRVIGRAEARDRNRKIEKKYSYEASTKHSPDLPSALLSEDLWRNLIGHQKDNLTLDGKAFDGYLAMMHKGLDYSKGVPKYSAAPKGEKPTYKMSPAWDNEEKLLGEKSSLPVVLGRAMKGIDAIKTSAKNGRDTTDAEKHNILILKAVLLSLEKLRKDNKVEIQGNIKNDYRDLSVAGVEIGPQGNRHGIEARSVVAARQLNTSSEEGRLYLSSLGPDNTLIPDQFRGREPLDDLNIKPINTSAIEKALLQARRVAEAEIESSINDIISNANTNRGSAQLKPLGTPTGNTLIDRFANAQKMQARSARQVDFTTKVKSSMSSKTGGFDVSNFERELGAIGGATEAKELENVLSSLVSKDLEEGMKNGLNTLINRLKLIRENLERANKQEILELMTRRQTYEDSMMSSALFRPQIKESSGILNLSRGEKFDRERIDESINAMGVGTDIAAFNQWSQSARQYEAINASSTSTDLEKASARSLISGVTYSAGMELNQDRDKVQKMQQRKRFNSLADAEEWNKNNMEVLHSKRADAQRGILEAGNKIAEKFKGQELTDTEMAQKKDADPDIKKAIATVKDIDKLLEQLGGSLERHVPRDDGFGKEFMTNMGRGLGVGFAEVQSQAEEIYTKLGVQLPHALRDGLTDAMMLAVEGADELGDRLKEIGTGFLKIIQRAFLESAASRVVGAFGMNSGGKVVGGSGVKDDVPAVLTGGEYVINRRSAQMYGYGFLEKLNRGEAQGFARGGAVNMNITAGRAAEREEYTDENKKYGDVTKYKTIKKGRAIDRRMSGFAIDNDPLIAKMFKEQESQFGEDLRTKEMLSDREKAKQQAKKNRKHMLLQVAAAAGIAWGAKKATDWAKKTKTYKKWSGRKFERRAKRDLDAGRGVKIEGNGQTYRLNNKQSRTDERAHLEKLYDDGRGESEMLKYAHSNRIRLDYGRGKWTKAPGNPYVTRPPTFREQVKVYNSGGSVPTQANSLLTGGEFVMGSSAVNKYGTGFMSRLNSGSISRHSEGGLVGSSGGSASNTNNDINITVNVDKSGGTQDTEVAGNSANEEKILAKKIKTAVLDVINDQRRVGGSLRG